MGVECDRLPPIGPNNWVGRLADVAYMSGLFGDDLPAQIAIRILAGDALGLTPANSLFDLKVSAAGSITWNQAGNYLNTADQIEIAKPNAAAGDAVEQNAADGVKDPSKSNVLAMPNQDGPRLKTIADYTGSDKAANKGPLTSADETDRAAETVEANSGPVLSEDPEPSPDSLQPGKDDAGPQSGDLAGQSEPIGDDPTTIGFDPADPGGDYTVKAEIDMRTGEIKSATIEPGSRPDMSAAAGLDVEATIGVWRTTIESNLRSLEFSDAKVEDKLKEFDGKNAIAKKAMFEQSESLIVARTEAKRFDVLRALANDGKTSLDQMKGFFFFADVPFDPKDWTYSEAAQAWRTLETEYPEVAKSIDPPAAAAESSAA